MQGPQRVIQKTLIARTMSANPEDGTTHYQFLNGRDRGILPQIRSLTRRGEIHGITIHRLETFGTETENRIEKHPPPTSCGANHQVGHFLLDTMVIGL